ncbi:MAG: DNA-protecting protein DprA [Calditrichaeota bacterium]|nr:MAG: DNA-protecting protein DprA [Calditrichota bacterium]
MQSQPINPFELIRLCSISGIGSQRIRNLLRRFHSPEAVFRASVRELVEVEGIDKTLAGGIKRGGDLHFVKEQEQLLKRGSAQIITFWDAAYPFLLKKICDPPIVLYLRGRSDLLMDPGIAVVGTRAPTSYGKWMTEHLTRELAAFHLVITSGLARGIDTITHQTAVNGGWRTIAVLGSGVDHIYPEENNRLAEKITESGALVSEFPMGSKPDAAHFPRRNRIISGMTLGVLVVEAGKKSGALITSDFALEQGREVFAVPGNVNNPKSCGCNTLIQQGAKLVMKVEDILEEFPQLCRLSQEQKKSNFPDGLSEKETLVYNHLSFEPQHIDRITLETGLSVAETLSVLLNLELKNLVFQTAGKQFIRQ